MHLVVKLGLCLGLFVACVPQNVSVPARSSASLAPSTSPEPSVMPSASPTPSVQVSIQPSSPPALTLTLLAGKAAEKGNFQDIPGPALEASFSLMGEICRDHKGNIYIPTHYHLMQLSQDGKVTILAGTGEPGHRDGAIPQAQFNTLRSCVCSRQGVIYVSDAKNGVIRRISEGVVDTLDRQGKFISVTEPLPAEQTFNSILNVYLPKSENELIITAANEYGYISIHAYDFLTQAYRTLFTQEFSGPITDGPLERAHFSYDLALEFNDDNQTTYILDKQTKTLYTLKNNQVSILAGRTFDNAWNGYNDADGSDRLLGADRGSRFPDPTSLAYDPHRKLIYISDGYFIRIVTLEGKVRTLPLPGQSWTHYDVIGPIRQILVMDENTLILGAGSTPRLYQLTLPPGELPTARFSSPWL